MTVQKFIIQLGSRFVTAAAANITVSTWLDISIVKSGLLAGGYAVLDVLIKLARAYRDGTLTTKEAQEALGVSS